MALSPLLISSNHVEILCSENVVHTTFAAEFIFQLCASRFGSFLSNIQLFQTTSTLTTMAFGKEALRRGQHVEQFAI